MSMTVPIELLEAKEEEHRIELAKLRMQLVVYRMALEDAGIEPPDKDGEALLEMWKDCRTVISTASQFVMKLGSSKELLVDWSGA